MVLLPCPFLGAYFCPTHAGVWGPRTIQQADGWAVSPDKAGMFTGWPGPLGCSVSGSGDLEHKPVQQAEPLWKPPGSGNCLPREAGPEEEEQRQETEEELKWGLGSSFRKAQTPSPGAADLYTPNPSHQCPLQTSCNKAGCRAWLGGHLLSISESSSDKPSLGRIVSRNSRTWDKNVP